MLNKMVSFLPKTNLNFSQRLLANLFVLITLLQESSSFFTYFRSLWTYWKIIKWLLTPAKQGYLFSVRSQRSWSSLWWWIAWSAKKTSSWGLCPRHGTWGSRYSSASDTLCRMYECWVYAWREWGQIQDARVPAGVRHADVDDAHRDQSQAPTASTGGGDSDPQGRES